MKSIIFIAPPAGGKGTQSNLVKEEYNIPHISTGDLLRGASNSTSPIANTIKELLSTGSLLPDEIVVELLKDRIKEDDCNNGYILDGFPRNIKQAEIYESMLKDLNKDLGIVILLSIDKEVAKERIVNRLSCPNCGAVYNNLIEGLKPNIEGKCDKCHTDLIRRSDDTAETYDKRYDEYILKTQPLIEYYKNKNILYEIDSSLGTNITFNKIKEILGSLK